MTDAREPVTRILVALDRGDDNAAEELLPLVYTELRRLAQSFMQHEKPGQTLQATALVHDAYLRLVGSEGAGWENRKHFFNAAAMAMRRILLDKARKKSRLKHGGEHERQPFDMLEIPVLAEFGLDEYEAVDAAIDKLADTDARWGEVVHMRLFLGFSVEQTAELLGVSPATVKNDFRFAMNWLRTQGDASTRD